MGHLTGLTRESYIKLQKRMDRFSPGIHDSESLYEILKILFTEEEAKICSVMPLTGFTIPQIANIWKKSEEEALEIVNELADKNLTYDFNRNGSHYYALAVPVLGFFEFSLMRTDGKFDRKILSELFYQYINKEEEGVKQFFSVETPLSRTFVYEDELDNITSEVLPYEKASHLIDSATCITVGTCFCRHKMDHMGKACNAPQDVCLTFNDMARYAADHKIAREIRKEEAHEILNMCIEHGLVQIGENLKEKIAIICNCCGCCCDLLLGYKRFNFHHAINPSNYVAEIKNDICNECGVCQKRCPVNAILKRHHKLYADENTCLGCGVCSSFCPTKACRMTNRSYKPYVPEKFYEGIILRAADQRKLGNLLFDDQISKIHIVLRNIFNVLLGLPGIRNLLLNKKLLPSIMNAFMKIKKVELIEMERKRAAAKE
jgi:Pyruvate/2-oxoacid:ferredoxin oxidoreductase delta subunit